MSEEKLEGGGGDRRRGKLERDYITFYQEKGVSPFLDMGKEIRRWTFAGPEGDE